MAGNGVWHNHIWPVMLCSSEIVLTFACCRAVAAELPVWDDTQAEVSQWSGGRSFLPDSVQLRRRGKQQWWQEVERREKEMNWLQLKQQLPVMMMMMMMMKMWCRLNTVHLCH